MDVRLRFQLPEGQYGDRACIIVVEENDMAVGLLVETVQEVTEIARDSIDSPPDVGNRQLNSLMKGIGKVGNEVKIVLDVSRLLHGEAEN